MGLDAAEPFNLGQRVVAVVALGAILLPVCAREPAVAARGRFPSRRRVGRTRWDG